ncbi:unnamed protein product [Blepharisma stoltei]|uniref:VWFA domain-containing protein n=1 Tax=Blepharisma stoltei TaxID=1481888 RepID=A0AAU9K841_9CILI|nr:unnamed protein product [Blepharisma stoltei]
MLSENDSIVLSDFRVISFVERALWYWKYLCNPQSILNDSEFKYNWEVGAPILEDSIRFRYIKYRILIMIDLAPSVYAYNFALKESMGNRITTVLRSLIESIQNYSQEIDIQIELGIICVRTPNEPIHVVVQSIELRNGFNSDDIIDQFESYMEEIRNDLDINFLNGAKESEIDFASTLKWALFALDLMDQPSMPAVIYITDCTNSNLASGIYDWLVVQYCRADVALNLINLSENISPQSFQYGFTPDPTSIKLMTSISGGTWISPDDIPLKVREIFYKKLVLKSCGDVNFLNKSHSQKYYLDHYHCEVPVENLVECILREGFQIRAIQPNKLVFWFILHFNTIIEYTLNIENPRLSIIELSIICKQSLFKKLKKEEKVAAVFSKESKISLASRVLYIIQNIKENEKFVFGIFQDIEFKDQKSLYEKISKLPTSKWQKWFHFETLDVLTAKQSQDHLISYGKDKVREKIRTLGSGLFFEDTYIELIEKSGLLIIKIVWELYNKATIYFGFFGCSNSFRIEKYQLCIQNLKKSALDVYDRPLGKIVVEETYRKKNYKSRVYSLFTYRPHNKVIKSYMCGFSSQFDLLATKSAQFFLNILHTSRTKQGFIVIGCIEKDKFLLIKPYECEAENKHRIFFLQYLMYISDYSVFIEFYHEPSIANYYDESDDLLDLKNEYEINDESIYKSLLSLDSLIFQCLENKLNFCNSNDLLENNGEFKMIDFSDEDDLFCYIQAENLEKAETFEDLKIQMYEKMYEVVSSFQDTGSCSIELDFLLKHSSCWSFDYETFSVDLDINTQQYRQIFEYLYSVLLRAFGDIADYQMSQKNQCYFARYACNIGVIMWTVPEFEELLKELSCNGKMLPIYVFECLQNKIDLANFEKRRSSIVGTANNSNTVFQKTLQLIQRVYKVVLLGTYYNFLGISSVCEFQLPIIETDFTKLLSCCEQYEETLNISKLNKYRHHLLMKSSGLSVIPKDLNAGNCDNIDSKFLSFISSNFSQLHDTEYFIYRDKDQDKENKFLLQISNYKTSLLNCFETPEIILTLFSFQNSNFFQKEKAVMKLQDSPISSKQTMAQNLIKIISEKLQSLLAELTLNTLSICKEIDIDLVEEVLLQFTKTTETVRFEFIMHSIEESEEAGEMIKLELERGLVISTLSIDQYFYAAGVKSFSKLMCIDEESLIDKLFSRNEETVSIRNNEHLIAFWVIIEIKQAAGLKCSFFLPDHWTSQGLKADMVKSQLLKIFKKIEVKVYQRILLNDLGKTGKLSELLMPKDNSNSFSAENSSKDSKEWAKKRFSRFSHVKSKNPESVPVSKLKTSYKLEVQHRNNFSVSDRLSKNESVNTLTMKFSTPPFIINNRNDLYMLIQGSDIFIFRFTEKEMENDEELSPPELKRSSSFSKTKFLTLEVFGIDKPLEETISKLEQRVCEQLQQISLFKLADSLIKNQKKVMSFSDMKFIKGSELPSIAFFPIHLVSSLELFLKYIKQNLMKFLLNFQVKGLESSVFVYNYLTVVESVYIKNNANRFISRQDRELTPFLGNTFGKALGIIQISICYYDGEAIYSEKKQQSAELKVNPKITGLFWRPGGAKVKCLPYPTFPGYYLEMKLYKNGHINESAFLDFIEQHLNQSLIEYLIEDTLKSTSMKNNFLGPSYLNMFESLRQIAIEATQIINPKINISIPSFEIFTYFCSLEKIINEAAEFSLPFIYCFKIGGQIFIENSIEEIKKHWLKQFELVSIICEDLWFSAFFYSAGDEQNQFNPLKFHSEKFEEETLLRSLLLGFELSKSQFLLFSYNWNRSILAKIHSSVETHIHSINQRYRLLNNILIQKLGLHSHNLPNDFLYPENRNSPEDQISAQILRTCSIMEIKEESIAPPGNSLAEIKECRHPLSLVEDPIRKCKPNEFLFCEKFVVSKLNFGDKLGIRIQDVYEWNDAKFVREMRKRGHLLCARKVPFIVQSWKIQTTQYQLMKSNIKIDKIIRKILKTISVEISGPLKLKQIPYRQYSGHRKHSCDNSFDAEYELTRSYSEEEALPDKIKPINLFLKKLGKQSVFLVELGYEKGFILSRAYSLDNENNFDQYLVENQDIKAKSTAHALTKSSLDLPTLAYDQYIKHTCEFLLAPEKYPWINILGTLTDFIHFYKSHPPKAKSWIYSSYVYIDLGNLEGGSAEEIYNYIANNHEAYSLNTPKHSHRPHPIFKVTKLPNKSNLWSGSLSPIKGRTANFNQPQPNENKGKNNVRAFVYSLIASTKETHLGTIRLEEGKNTNNIMSIRYYIINYTMYEEQSGESLKMIIKKTEKSLVETIKLAKLHSRRDKLWQKLKNLSKSDTFSDNELNELLSLSIIEPLEEIDQRIKSLCSLTDAFTQNYFNYLIRIYQERCKMIKKPSHIDLCVFSNPSIFICLNLNCAAKKMSMKLVRRISDSNLEEEEDELLSDLINKSLHWLWYRMSTSN